jgi:Ca2+-binding RTX toxin-like protein
VRMKKRFSILSLATLGGVLAAVSLAAGNVTTIGGTPGSPYFQQSSCQGHVVDGVALQGDNANDNINGTPNIDLLRGGGGNDKLKGKAGNDCLAGQAGNDILKGGRGNDKLTGGSGNDILKGGPGADILNCGSGNDVAFADSSDTVKANCETVH